MPLLLCPNDNSSMQTVDRAGVQFDMCPACRGVWLDRGELEKLMASDGQDAPSSQAAQQPAPRQSYDTGYREGGGRGDYRDRDERRDHGDYGRGFGGHRKKRSSIFDIFD